MGQLGGDRSGKQHFHLGGPWVQSECGHDVVNILLCQFLVLLPAPGANQGKHTEFILSYANIALRGKSFFFLIFTEINLRLCHCLHSELIDVPSGVRRPQKRAKYRVCIEL